MKMLTICILFVILGTVSTFFAIVRSKGFLQFMCARANRHMNKGIETFYLCGGAESLPSFHLLSSHEKDIVTYLLTDMGMVLHSASFKERVLWLLTRNHSINYVSFSDVSGSIDKESIVAAMEFIKALFVATWVPIHTSKGNPPTFKYDIKNRSDNHDLVKDYENMLGSLIYGHEVRIEFSIRVTTSQRKVN